jgi:DNA-binding response OmpR family regulator
MRADPATALPRHHHRCREVGIEEFIVKPFRVEDLRRVVRCAPRRPASTEQDGKIVAPCQC